ncbi:S-adenosyl-L-methionine-dependent methyltransferase [Gigaspora margarita]|uniref:S-adenosyl-L-methionine-dependent methyltransferase n=1 Tax=Gigaspora margarita TaxID=4874 RepID=A0A8H4A6R4_GIGMA|nr:S-adenosyl-L-methionine-dependent methyltransferase [Gigaspora margarita]
MKFDQNKKISTFTSKTSTNPMKQILLKYADNGDNNFETFLQLNTHKILNGRKYINDDEVNYLLPIDKIEADREAISYAIRRCLFQKYFFAPIGEKLNTGATVLDIGCGPGFWIKDVGLDHPSSTFIGIDIATTQFPPHDRHPSNVGFLRCNATHGIPFPSETFDFVHISMMCTAFTEYQWYQVIKDVVRVLKYSGWVEIIVSDPLIKNLGKAGKLVMETFFEICEKQEHISAEYPIGDWGGCLGKYAATNLRKALEGIVLTDF